MKSIRRHFPLLLCLALWTHAEEKAEVVALRPVAFLIHDYLPSAIYEGDGLTSCFRVENASGAKAEFEFSGVAFDAEGKELKTLTKKALVAPSEFASLTLEFDSQRVARVQYALKCGAELIAKSGIVLVREDNPWPATRCAAGKIADSNSGDVVIPVVQKKRTEERRAFAPLRWVFGESKSGETPHSGQAIMCIPGAWKIGIKDAVALGPFSADGTPPILNALNSVMRALDAQRGVAPKPAVPKKLDDEKVPEKAGELNPWARMVIALPPEDLELATEPQIYHVILEAMLARLGRAGVSEIVLVAPFKFGCNDVHRKAIWREIHAVAGLYSARVVDPVDWMAPSVWLLDPASPGVYAPIPNASGRKMIEQALVDLIK